LLLHWILYVARLLHGWVHVLLLLLLLLHRILLVARCLHDCLHVLLLHRVLHVGRLLHGRCHCLLLLHRHLLLPGGLLHCLAGGFNVLLLVLVLLLHVLLRLLLLLHGSLHGKSQHSTTCQWRPLAGLALLLHMSFEVDSPTLWLLLLLGRVPLP
jgi:hypothetical protein